MCHGLGRGLSVSCQPYTTGLLHLNQDQKVHIFIQKIVHDG
jgi:hypothetical protein